MPTPNTTSMTTPSSTALPRLVPTDIAPVGQSERSSPHLMDTAAAAALQRVLALSVRDTVDTQGKTQYEVHVTLQSPHNRIPIATVPGRSASKPRNGDDDTAASLFKPDVVAVNRFGVFRALRDDVYFAAQDGHVPGEGLARSCSFCASVVDAVLLDQMQPHRYDEWIRTSSSVSSRLEAFLLDLLSRARGDDTASRRAQRPRCGVQAHVQALLVQFLQLHESSPLP